ncbi:MAG TPA: ABC transporter permease [Gemmatimonadota bacterium]|nr:ABC transporter permease [Gemmatimonadota bacterium]
MLDAPRQDLRFALRQVRRNPGFALVVVLTLALGIGTSTAIFSVVDATLLRPLPFRDADRLVFLRGYARTPEGPRIRGGSYPEVLDWGRMSSSFTDVSVLDGVSLTLGGDGSGSESAAGAETIDGEVVSADYFQMLGVQPILGRTFTPREAAVPGAAVVVIGEDLWARRFGRDPDVLGSTIRIDRQPHTVIGVLPARFRGMSFTTGAWIPAGHMFDLGTAGGGPEDRGNRWLGAVARLAPGTSPSAAQSDLDRVAARLAAAYPRTNEDRGVRISPVRDVLLGDTGTLVLVLMGAVGLLLLIACANVANLLLARASARSHELLTRRALGAGRGRVVRQLLIESAVLAAAGTFPGILLARAALSGLVALVPTGILPAYATPRLDLPVLLFAVGLLGVTGLLSGLAPAWEGGRASLAGGLRGAGRGAIDGGGNRPFALRHVLVGAEVAVALVLLIGAGLMMRSLRNQLRVDSGFDPGHVLAFRLSLPEAAYDRDEVTPFVRELTRRLEGIPGVDRAVVASDLPLRGISSAAIFSFLPEHPQDRIRVYLHRVQGGYFDALGIPIQRGRAFRPEEEKEGADVAILGASYAERYFHGQDPLGKTVLLGKSRFTVVGVTAPVRVRDVTSDIVTGDDDPDLYIPFSRAPDRSFAVAVRGSTGRPEALLPSVRHVVERLDPALPVARAAPLADGLRSQTALPRFGASLFGSFSLLALLLAAVGIYGVVAVSVGLARGEIAVRMALGADRPRVLRLVVGRAMRPALLGAAIGLAAALAGTRVLRSLLYGVDPTDGLSLAGAAAVLLATAVAAAYLPARRAARLDPARTLREE